MNSTPKRVKEWAVIQAAMVMEQRGLSLANIAIGLGVPTARAAGLLSRGRQNDDRPLPGVFAMRPKKVRATWCECRHNHSTLWAPHGPFCFACLIEWMNEKREP